MPSSSPPDTKASFRRLSSDAANRKYRRRSPSNGSSSSGSPKHDHSASPIFLRDDPAKVSEHQQRKDDERELDRDSGRSHHVRGGDSFKHSDHQSSRSSHNYSRHDDYTRHDKYPNDEDRNYHRLSSHSGRESRDHSTSKDYLSNADKSSRDRYDVTGHRSKDKEKESSYLERQKNKEKDSSSDRVGSGRKHTCTDSDNMDRDWHKQDRDGRDEKIDYRRSSADHRNDRRVTYDYEKSIGHRNDSSSGKTYRGYQFKEAHRSDPKGLDGQKLDNEGKKKHDDGETNRDKDRYYRADKPDFSGVKQETPTKKQKFSNWDKGADNVKDASGKLSSSSMQAQDIGGTEVLAQAHSNDSVANELDAAKVAAMRAAELVNKNLVGVGYLSTDQKKKLLWGNKKSTTAEESGHRWDSALFGDSDRQEKFNKLMGVKGDVKVEHKPSNQDGGGLLQAEKQREQLQQDLEKQYTAGLRRRDGRTVGLGL